MKKSQNFIFALTLLLFVSLSSCNDDVQDVAEETVACKTCPDGIKVPPGKSKTSSDRKGTGQPTEIVY